MCRGAKARRYVIPLNARGGRKRTTLGSIVELTVFYGTSWIRSSVILDVFMMWTVLGIMYEVENAFIWTVCEPLCYGLMLRNKECLQRFALNELYMVVGWY